MQHLAIDCSTVKVDPEAFQYVKTLIDRSPSMITIISSEPLRDQTTSSEGFNEWPIRPVASESQHAYVATPARAIAVERSVHSFTLALKAIVFLCRDNRDQRLGEEFYTPDGLSTLELKASPIQLDPLDGRTCHQHTWGLSITPQHLPRTPFEQAAASLSSGTITL